MDQSKRSMLREAGSRSGRRSNDGLVASEPLDVQPTSIGRDSAGEVYPNERRQAPCRNSTSGLPMSHSESPGSATEHRLHPRIAFHSGLVYAN